jgi:hypothetical protein
MLFTISLGCIVFLLTNLSLLYASHLLARRILCDSPAAMRMVGMGIFYYGFIIAILQLLSPLHAITRTGVTTLCLLLTLVTHIVWGRHRNIKADIDAIRSWIRDGLRSPWAFLMVICGFVVLLSFARALLTPPLAWDCLTYHLTFAALWIQKGTIFLFKAPDQIITAAHLPINGELFAAWLLLPFHNDIIVNVMNFPLTLLGGGACYAIARELGLNRKDAGFAPALICFAPMIYWQILTQYVDNAAFAFYCSSVLFALVYIRTGYPWYGLLALAATGILIGIKYTAIPAAGLLLLVVGIRTMRLPKGFGGFRKSGLILSGLLIVCLMGGRQYLFNAIEARNPLYPFPLSIGQQEIFRGVESLEEINEWVDRYEMRNGQVKMGFWERQYRAFLYMAVSAGPKFMLFLLLACVSFFVKPARISRGVWYFLAVMWIMPLILYNVGASSRLASGGPWLDGNTRYLSSFFALFTLQGLVSLKNTGRNIGWVNMLLTAFVLWDLLMANVGQRQDVEMLYPLLPLAGALLIVMVTMAGECLNRCVLHDEYSSAGTMQSKARPSRLKQSSRVCMIVALMIMGAYLLQLYREGTRYEYLSAPTDLNAFQRISVNGWEFLDKPGEKRTIAMAMAWDPPGHKWILYPLLGRHLQNDVVYISARYKWDVPSWLDNGEIRGEDASIWRFNLNNKNVDYIFVADPIAYPLLHTGEERAKGVWPIELGWMENDPGNFRLVFADRYCKIFKCVRSDKQ